MKSTICFDDVLLEPQYSEICSRSEIDIGNTLKNVGRLNLPVISAPMDTITGSKMAMAMFAFGGVGIIHRYNSIPQQVAKVHNACFNEQRHVVGVAIGVNNDFVNRAKPFKC